ncbi:MAG: hypothetical protein A3D59_01020 [Candidatus Wildermuthbacteria bacterium RIFCSPHIGHO2_02_FULL_47_17]|uniref:Glycosyltransferase RgtA/B/C/D-like domain-containing protein n=1 Tax=Candidatus Wildermuthbacteria bacterium RIFCSPHIGHO2_02_FULL_47_17 TaxID=1802452 RepID=A0A1G2R7C6_9BACT|nr:MAG: hypothetical protein A3D59_01020 [Candidatus Wildermuthbacteria bacterium RIFCSPHIGHO2_02_FULL_47_17]
MFPLYNRFVAKKKIVIAVWLIFLAAVVVRFLWFRESTYFGFDEARDAFTSLDIFLKHDWKLIGPPATGNLGLFHGPLFWYFLGPLYLLGRGDVFFVSAVFRLINAAGVFGVFYIAGNLFTPWVGLVAALFYAVSFEQYQYAMYVGNPTLGVWCWLSIFIGAVMLYKKDRQAKWAPALMLAGAALGMQLNLMFAYFFLPVFLLLFLLRKNIVWDKKSVLAAIGLPLALLATYFLGEMKRGFLSVKKAVELIASGWVIMSPGQTKTAMYLEKFRAMFHDNLLLLPGEGLTITALALIMVALLLKFASKEKPVRLILVWIFAWLFLAPFGGHLAYYTHVGLAVGLLIGSAYLLGKLRKTRGGWLAYPLILMVMFSNLYLISAQAKRSLIFQIKPQPDMRLVDELAVIDLMYEEAEGKGYTVRLTGIPYRIQTVWAYLFKQYGVPKWGYYPFWETGNIEGFAGYMPPPKSGTTCLRYLIREPLKGLPIDIINEDIKTENIFSRATSKKEIGWFIWEKRQARDTNCHDNKPI